MKPKNKKGNAKKKTVSPAKKKTATKKRNGKKLYKNVTVRKSKSKAGFLKSVVVDFANRQKNINEKFSDLVHFTTYPVLHDDGEFKEVGNTEFLISMFDINKKTFNKWLMFGVPVKDQTKKFIKKLEELLTDFDIAKTKRKSKTFNRNTFNYISFDEFFEGKNMTGHLFSKSQIYAVMNSNYIIPNYNFAVSGKKMNSVKKKMFDEINRIIKSWQSLNYFYFNFLIVEKYKQKTL